MFKEKKDRQRLMVKRVKAKTEKATYFECHYH